MLSIEFQELSLRAVDPEDPHLPEIAQRIGQQYLPKLPEYRENVLGLFEKIGLKDLWQSVIGNEEARVKRWRGRERGVWTPEGRHCAGFRREALASRSGLRRRSGLSKTHVRESFPVLTK